MSALIPVCGKCGQPHIAVPSGGQACAGHLTGWNNGVLDPERVGRPCKRTPSPGLAVCVKHGAGAPQVRAAAKKRREAQEAVAIMARYAERDHDADPGELLLDLICWTSGEVKFYRAKVQEAAMSGDEDDALVWGITKQVTGGKDAGTTSEAKPITWLALYDAAKDRLQKYCVDAIKVGLKEREIRMAERQADTIVAMIDGILTQLGHNPAAPEVAQVVAGQFRLHAV